MCTLELRTAIISSYFKVFWSQKLQTRDAQRIEVYWFMSEDDLLELDKMVQNWTTNWSWKKIFHGIEYYSSQIFTK